MSLLRFTSLLETGIGQNADANAGHFGFAGWNKPASSDMSDSKSLIGSVVSAE